MEIFEVAESHTNASLGKEELYTYIDNTEFSDEIKGKIKGMLGVAIVISNKHCYILLNSATILIEVLKLVYQSKKNMCKDINLW